jgi:hypothetical protein
MIVLLEQEIEVMEMEINGLSAKAEQAQVVRRMY